MRTKIEKKPCPDKNLGTDFIPLSYLITLLIFRFIFETKTVLSIMDFSTFSGFTSEQQFGHFVAIASIDDLQYGHVLFKFFPRILLTVLTNKNIANIVIKKLIKELIKRPIFNVVAPADWAAATVE